MIKNRLHHTNAFVARLYLPRKKGRGLLNLEELRRRQIPNLRKYFKEKDTELLKTISNKDIYSPLKLQDNNLEQTLQIVPTQRKYEERLAKSLHGKYPKALELASGHPEELTRWLTSGNLFAETEGFIYTIQDEVINTLN